jgi:hypothetical protein
MSRGLGKAQRLVLDALRVYPHGLSAYEIVHFGACGGKLTKIEGWDARGERLQRCEKKECDGPYGIDLAKVETVRRAIRTLAKAGLVESLSYPVLCARLPLTPQEKEEEDKIKRHIAALVTAAESLKRRTRKQG